MSIFVCGDIHSTLDINKLDQFIERDDLTEKDYLIICGDTGICGLSKEQETATREYLRKLSMGRGSLYLVVRIPLIELIGI